MFKHLLYYAKKLFVFKLDDIKSLSSNLKYYINDPTTPQLSIDLNIPRGKEPLPFSVVDFVEPIENDISLQAANCYITVFNSIQYTQDKLENKIKHWAGVNRLKVIPRAGQDFNAYYDRRHLKFFFAFDKIANKTIFTADSADIVAHELGHALLDAMRPDFWSVQSLEIWSFHEAFADISALLSAMQYDKMLEYILEETKGNIRESNSLSRLAEEMGNAISNLTGGQTPFGYLRNAVNNFKYTIPENLPQEGPDNELVAECHSFGRVFLGTWYEIFCYIYEIEVLNGSDKMTAIKKSRDVCATYLLKAIKMSPRCNRYHNAVAKAMITIDEQSGSPYKNILEKVFTEREILLPQVKILSNKTMEEVLTDNSELIKNGNKIIIKSMNNNLIKLKNNNEISALSCKGVNLSDVDIEIPMDSYYEFDTNGNMLSEIIPDEVETIESAKLCVMSIANKQDLGDNNLWKVEEGKLKRNYII